MLLRSIISHYNVYCDTLTPFTPDTSNLLKEVFFDEDTTSMNFQAFVPVVPSGYPLHFYIVKAVDLEGRESDDSNLAWTVITGDQDIDIPTNFSLAQNYPNPFNPVTEINYSLAEDCLVKLDIFNIVGQKISTLVNKRQDAGVYSIRWNARNTASGIYFYRITAGTYYNTKKMVLLR